MAKVSFVLAAYKRRFLKEAIASVLAQTYRDFELVVVDDCSPENLKEVVDEFRDERLSYRRNEHNLGRRDLVASWNHAMRYAKGEWCVLASDDDVYHPGYLQEMIRLSEKYPNVDLFHCRISIIDGGGNLVWIGAPRAEHENWIQMIYHTAIVRIDQRMAELMFRRKTYDRAGGFFWSPTAWYTDLGTAILFSQEKGAVCSSRMLFGFRMSGENITTQHGDAALKVEAGIQFRDWISRLVGQMPPVGSEDEVFVREIVRRNDAVVMGVIRWVLQPLSFFDYYRTIKGSRLSAQQKRQLILGRMRRMASPCQAVRNVCGAVKRKVFRG